MWPYATFFFFFLTLSCTLEDNVLFLLCGCEHMHHSATKSKAPVPYCVGPTDAAKAALTHWGVGMRAPWLSCGV